MPYQWTRCGPASRCTALSRRRRTLPGNPVYLEQREGRVHRFKGHAVRRNIGAAQCQVGLSATGDPGQAMFDVTGRGREARHSEMDDLHVAGITGQDRHVVYVAGQHLHHTPRGDCLVHCQLGDHAVHGTAHVELVLPSGCSIGLVGLEWTLLDVGEVPAADHLGVAVVHACLDPDDPSDTASLSITMMGPVRGGRRLATTAW